jgi:nucleotide-binding universal stress UspA family protein
MTPKILALVDSSVYAQSVCDHTAWIAKRLNASVNLLHVLGRREGVATGDLSGSLKLGARSALLEELATLDAQRAKLSQAQGHAILDDAKAIIERAGVGPVTTRLQHGDLLEAVGELEPEISVVVVGKRGDGADFASSHLGSNLERIVRTSKIPVFAASRSFQPISKILIAFDGGNSATRAVERISESTFFKGMSITLSFIGSETPEILTKLDTAYKQLSIAGLDVTADVTSGEPEKVLEDKVNTENFGLLVMGAYGHSRIRNLIIGSLTTTMIRSCKIPILLYR